MRDVVERKQPSLGKITDLGASLLIVTKSAVAIVALIEGDNGARCVPLKLLPNSRQNDMRPALSLVIFVGESNTCIWIVQDRVRSGRRIP